MNASVRKWLIRTVPTWMHPILRSAQFIATAKLGRLMRALPGTSESFGPPRRMAPTLADFASRPGGPGHEAGIQYVQLLGVELMTRSNPQSIDGGIHQEFVREAQRVAPAVGVAAIPNGRVLTATGAVIASGDYLLADVSDNFLTENPETNEIFLTTKLPAVQIYDGSVAVLTTFRSNIYYHWLLDTLPRLSLLQQSGMRYEKVVVPAHARFQRESLKLLGIEEARILSDPRVHLQARNLLVPSLPGVPGNPPSWACEFLRDCFLPHVRHDRPASERLFISRANSGTRRIRNEPALLAALAKRGFERVFLEDLSFLEQVKVFSEARIIVSPHGSGLANLVFCRPEAELIEIFSPNYINVMYWTIANQVDVRYHYICGDGRVSAERGRRVHEDITVDVPRLVAAVDGIIARNRSDAERPRESRDRDDLAALAQANAPLAGKSSQSEGVRSEPHWRPAQA